MIKNIRFVAIKRNGKWEGGLSLNDGSYLIGERGHQVRSSVESVLDMSEYMDVSELAKSVKSYSTHELDQLAKTTTNPQPQYTEDTNTHQLGMFLDAPTPSQRKYAEDLIKTHNLSYVVRTRTDAEYIIETYKTKITPNQFSKITDIEHRYDVAFIGSTRDEATEFINSVLVPKGIVSVQDSEPGTLLTYYTIQSSTKSAAFPEAIAFSLDVARTYFSHCGAPEYGQLSLYTSTTYATKSSIIDKYKDRCKIVLQDSHSGNLFIL